MMHNIRESVELTQSLGRELDSISYIKVSQAWLARSIYNYSIEFSSEIYLYFIENFLILFLGFWEHGEGPVGGAAPEELFLWEVLDPHVTQRYRNIIIFSNSYTKRG